jgi:hypothetical protein
MSRIACLAWGSLEWDPRDLQPHLATAWFNDGPTLPLEFARVSKDGRLTLVLLAGGSAVPVLWAEMNVENAELAREAIRRREGCSTTAVGVWPGDPNRIGYSDIERWARAKGLDHVVWTALGPKFNDKPGPPLDAQSAVEYLRNLPAPAKQLAEEYVRRAPPQIKTVFRSVFETELGWAADAAGGISAPHTRSMPTESANVESVRAMTSTAEDSEPLDHQAGGERLAPRLSGFDPREVFHQGLPFQPGEGDLIVGGSTAQVMGRMAAALFLGCVTKERKRWFSGITVVAPPLLAWNHPDEAIFEMLVKGAEDYRGDPLAQDERDILRRKVRVVRCDWLNVALVLAAARTCEPRQVLLVPEAALFRDQDIPEVEARGRSMTLIAEDVWTPHVASLARKLLPIAKEAESHVVLIASDLPPASEQNRKLLVDVSDLYPAYVGFNAGPEPGEVLKNSVPKWVAMAASGRVAQALTEIDDSDLTPEFKAQLKVQVAARSDDDELIERLIQEVLQAGHKLPDDIAGRIARISYRSGDEQTAKKLIAQCSAGISGRALLEALLESSTQMRATELVAQLWTRLATLHPESAALVEDCEVRVLQLCQCLPDADAGSAQSRIGLSGFQHFVVDTLSAKELVDYSTFLQTVEGNWPSERGFSHVCAAVHALTWKRAVDSLNLAVAACESTRYRARAVRLVVHAMRRFLLLELRPNENAEGFKEPLAHLIRYLASHADDSQTRASVARVLSVDTAGALGLPMLVSFTLDTVGAGVRLGAPTVTPKPLEPEEFKARFEALWVWMSAQPAIEVGVTRIPADLVGGDPGRFIASLAQTVRRGAQMDHGEDDLSFIEQCAQAVCLVTPFAPEGAPDLDVLRVVASKAALLGRAQHARDIAEQLLQLAGTEPSRLRAAWACYADIYQRTGSPIDALLGISCAASCDVAVEPNDVFQEAYVLLRVARDLRFHDLARNVLEKCRQLTRLQGLAESATLRLDGVEIGLRLASTDRADLRAIEVLLRDARAHCERVLQEEDELFTPASNYAQAMGLVQRHGGTVRQEDSAFLAQLLKKFDGGPAQFLQSLSAAFPSVDQMLTLHNRMQPARNSEYATADSLSAVIAAKRVLLPQAPQLAPEDAALAIELLAERALELPAPGKPLERGRPGEAIRQLSMSGVEVLMLAMDEAGELVAVLTDAGEITMVRPAAKAASARRRLLEWGRKYPYRLGLIEREEGNGEFYSAMAEFNIPIPKGKRVLVIAQPALLGLPYNLALVADRFAGSSKAIALVPSLTWLDAVRARSRNENQRLMAWISVPLEPEQLKTLDMVYQRLLPSFEEYGFQIDNSRRIPNGFQGARMAVVTAHGQLTSDARYIHRIADDEALAESPTSLANALAGVELTILFVCSGGRVDEHPHANTSVSLPKLLLDRGCRTVIASPWPVAAAVPGNWFEGFMQAWNAGATTFEANLFANKNVEARLGPEPQYCLAMTVYGDGLLQK